MLENPWLIGAVALSLFTHILVIYVPFLQTAFHTVPLSMSDWAIATAVAATLLIGMELVKLVLRMERRSASTTFARPAHGRSH
jgi:magnesium-transporting ATPase (P-type)